MSKTSPAKISKERLAAALRANLKRRKAGPSEPVAAGDPAPQDENPEKPVEKGKTPPNPPVNSKG
jgi:hypothetical protein